MRTAFVLKRDTIHRTMTITDARQCEQADALLRAWQQQQTPQLDALGPSLRIVANADSFGPSLEAAVVRSGLSLKEVARRCGRSDATLRKYLRLGSKNRRGAHRSCSS